MADSPTVLSATQFASAPKRKSYGTALVLGLAGIVTLGWISLLGWAALLLVSL